MEEKAKVIISPDVKSKEIVATCSVCVTELSRDEWYSLGDYSRKMKQFKKSIAKCPYCGAVFKEETLKANIKWERTKDGDYIAKAKNGDFLVWKYGYGYKCRYRAYGAESPDGVIWKRTREEAMKVCKQHPEWKI